MIEGRSYEGDQARGLDALRQTWVRSDPVMEAIGLVWWIGVNWLLAERDVSKRMMGRGWSPADAALRPTR